MVVAGGMRVDFVDIGEDSLDLSSFGMEILVVSSGDPNQQDFVLFER